MELTPMKGAYYDLRLQISESSSISFAIMYGLPGNPTRSSFLFRFYPDPFLTLSQVDLAILAKKSGLTEHSAANQVSVIKKELVALGEALEKEAKGKGGGKVKGAKEEDDGIIEDQDVDASRKTASKKRGRGKKKIKSRPTKRQKTEKETA